ncbi:ATP-binding protein [Streptomyces sp. NPDC046853]|uniref:ATP-binding protein n=1 Tax=Streptomyces sp. NPDC046853 TaxID=3154920 RepID=UPI0033E1B932
MPEATRAANREATRTEPDEPWEYTLYVPHDLRAVTIGRRALRLVLAAHGLPHLAEVAELVATELLSNALRHTKGPAALRLRWAGRVLRIGVWDGDPTPPELPPDVVSAYAEEGRGLALVRSCSEEWGWYALAGVGEGSGGGGGAGRGGGKYVWCELAAA